MDGRDEAAGEEKDNCHDGDNDKENVHRNSRPIYGADEHTLRGVVCGYG
jgi:hypothetical protein